MCLRCVNCFAFTVQSISMQFITQWFLKKNLTKFHKYSNTGRGFKLVFSKVVTVTFKRTLCMCTKYRKYESTKKTKKTKIIQLQYIVVCINKILRQHLIKLHNFFLLLNTKKDVSLFLFWQCMLIWSSASLWQVMNHNNNKK